MNRRYTIFTRLAAAALLSLLVSAVACTERENMRPEEQEQPRPQQPQQPDNGTDNGTDDKDNKEDEPMNTKKIILGIGGREYTATLADTAAARAFAALLPMTLDMSELNGNEKFCYMPQNLPTSAENPRTIENGDLMLYGSSCAVLFYKTFATSYSYTRLGRVDNPEGLESAVGRGSVKVSFAKAEE